MLVTLSNGKKYRIGFKHYYEQNVYLDTQGSSQDYFWAPVKSTRYPKITECFLKDIETGEVFFRGVACKNPKDNPNKELARKVAIGRMLECVDSDIDRAEVMKAYTNRSRAKAKKV